MTVNSPVSRSGCASSPCAAISLARVTEATSQARLSASTRWPARSVSPSRSSVLRQKPHTAVLDAADAKSTAAPQLGHAAR